jgi:lipopolysaccharide export system permease protein
MVRTRHYLLRLFGRNYLLIFLPFFIIISLVFFVRISVLSSKIDLDAIELVKLFGYFVPEIVFFTIPVSFIAALANTFGKLSESNELTALFSLGHRPSSILLHLLPVTILFSTLLLVVSVFAFPQFKQKLSQFKREKIAQATLNIQPNRLSQNFGNFHVFVESKNGDKYGNIVLLNREKSGKYQLFIAKEGIVKNEKSLYSISLVDGVGESSSDDKIQTLEYDRLTIYQYPHHKMKNLVDIGTYWLKALHDKGRMADLLYLIFVSLSPLLSFGPLMALSIYNPRYHSNRAPIAIFVTALMIYTPAALLQKYGNIPIFLALLTLFAFIDIYMIRYGIIKRY